ncbi:SurA N-terminal domain-containing protein [Halothiobacillus sp.]|uniref:SurA N-terminal domain-containing protein n=1 Tax=Halothiobacillus sp. TaxID=1891311 RepID=UPI0026120583|nr:SurA N-terminal domain-containing protein [Halothiobacillus sp.]
MLMDLRERIQGWIAYVIIGLISVPFVLWGVGEYFSGAKNKPVAEVDGLPISQQAFEQAVSQQRQAIIQKLGGSVSAELLQSLNLDQQVLDQMINERVLNVFVHKAGFRAPDVVVADLIRSEPAFKTNGVFDVKKYEAFVAARGATVADFEAGLKQDIVMQTLENAISESTIVTAPELDQIVRLRDQTREIGMVRIDRARVVDSVAAPTDVAIEAYYGAHKTEFIRPERVKLRYIELSPQTLAPLVKVTAAQVEQAYADYVKKQNAQVVRTVRHILISVPKNADGAAIEAAKNKALAARAAIVSGKISFGDEARAISDDPGSKNQGGDLGEVAPGQMVKPFEEAMDGIKVGVISEPVRTEFGWHLIEVTKESHPDIKPLVDVHDKLVAEVQDRQVEKIYYDEGEKLSDQSYEHPDSLIPSAEALGLKVQTSDWLNRDSGTGIAASEKVRQAAFSKEVLEQKLNSNLIELGANHAVVIRVDQHEPATQLPLADVKNQIARTLKQQAIDQALADAAKQIGKAIDSGKEPQVAATAVGATWVVPVWLKRTARDAPIPAEAIQAAFALPPAPEGQLASKALALSDGNEALVVVQAIKDGDPTAISEQDKKALSAEIQQAQAQQTLGVLLKALRDEAKITIHQKAEKTATP